MTTATATPVNMFKAKILISGDELKINVGTKTCVMSVSKVDAVWESLTPSQKNVMTPIVNVDKGVLTDDELSVSDMNIIVAVRTLSEAYVAPSKPEVPSDEVVAVLAIPPAELSKPEAKPLPTNGMVTSPVAQFPNHTTTVEIPAGDDVEEYTGGGKVRKKRVRKTDERMLAIQKASTQRLRGIGFSAMERRISALEKARDFFADDIEEYQYDIPTPIRAEIPEPTRVIDSCGGLRVTESTGLIKTKDLEKLRPYFDILDEYAEGTPNAIRLGCFTHYDHIEVSFKSREKLRARASRVVDNLLRQAHTSLIKMIAKADEALKEAMGDENKTLSDLEKEQCGRDNLYRAAINNAAEKLNVALMHCEQYDTNMETKELFKATYAAIDSIRASFNADCAKRGAKGVDVG